MRRGVVLACLMTAAAALAACSSGSTTVEIPTQPAASPTLAGRPSPSPSPSPTPTPTPNPGASTR